MSAAVSRAAVRAWARAGRWHVTVGAALPEQREHHRPRRRAGPRL